MADRLMAKHKDLRGKSKKEVMKSVDNAISRLKLKGHYIREQEQEEDKLL